MTPSNNADERVAVTGSPRHLARAAGVELLGPMQGSGHIDPPLLVRRADGQTIQLTPLLYDILRAAGPDRTAADVARTVSARHGRSLSAADVTYLVERKLEPLGVVRLADGTEPETHRTDPLLGLKGRIVLSRPDLTRRLTDPFVWLFRPGVVAATVLAFVAASWYAIALRGLGSAVSDAVTSPTMLLVIIAATVASAAFHELGHAAACRYGGATPASMGAALYLIWPVFYTDVTDSYRLGRAGRLRVDLGGLYFNAVFTVATVGLALVSGVEALLVLVPIQLLQMVRQLVPLVRFDGYHVLADLVGVPDLFARIGPTLRGVLPRRYRGTGASDLRPWARWTVTAWVAVTVPALVFVMGWVVIGLPAAFRASVATLDRYRVALFDHVAGGEVSRAALTIVAMLTVAIVPLSMLYLTGRIGSRSARRFWLATDGHPVPRAIAVASVVLVLVATASDRWPADPAPVEVAGAVAEDGAVAVSTADLDSTTSRSTPAPHNGGSASNVRSADRPGSLAVVSSPVVEHVPDQVGSDVTPPLVEADVVEPATQVESPSEPVPARVAVPDPVRAANAWPFPFDPPSVPEPGDNQTLVVNQTDGATATDMSTSFQWLDDSPMRQANRAFALARCVDCTTVAISFQVLIADGMPTTVVPRNAAVAVNYECELCITQAIAVQQIFTLHTSPPAKVKAQVRAAFNKVRAVEARHRTLGPAAVRKAIMEIEAEIDGLLRPYSERVTDPATAAGSTMADSRTSPSDAAVDAGSTDDSAEPVEAADLVGDMPVSGAEVDPVGTSSTGSVSAGSPASGEVVGVAEPPPPTDAPDDSDPGPGHSDPLEVEGVDAGAVPQGDPSESAPPATDTATTSDGSEEARNVDEESGTDDPASH